MKNIIKITVILAVILIVNHLAVAQSDFDEVQIKTISVKGNIYMLEGAGGNIGVSVGVDGILMIDDQFAPLADKIKAALKDLNPGHLKFVLNTHVHGDHVGGNTIFGEHATIIAHDNIRNRMIELFKKDSTAQGKGGWPVITFDNSLTIHFNDETIEVIHLPKGHTDGDGVIYFKESNVIHAGDLLFSGMFPFIDLDKGGTVDGYIENVDHLISKMDDSTKIIPGHGPLSTITEFKTFSNMLHTTTKMIRAMKSEGMTADDIIAKGLGDEWKDWSWSFIPEDRWIKTIYRDSK